MSSVGDAGHARTAFARWLAGPYVAFAIGLALGVVEPRKVHHVAFDYGLPLVVTACAIAGLVGTVRWHRREQSALRAMSDDLAEALRGVESSLDGRRRRSAAPNLEAN